MMKKVLFSSLVLTLALAFFAATASAESTVLKTRHETAKNSISNIR